MENYYKDLPQDTFLYVYRGCSYRPAEASHAPPGADCWKEDGEWWKIPLLFAGMREYDGTDPMNRINWKASARSET